MRIKLTRDSKHKRVPSNSNNTIKSLSASVPELSLEAAAKRGLNRHGDEDEVRDSLGDLVKVESQRNVNPTLSDSDLNQPTHSRLSSANSLNSIKQSLFFKPAAFRVDPKLQPTTDEGIQASLDNKKTSAILQAANSYSDKMQPTYHFSALQAQENFDTVSKYEEEGAKGMMRSRTTSNTTTMDNQKRISQTSAIMHYREIAADSPELLQSPPITLPRQKDAKTPSQPILGPILLQPVMYKKLAKDIPEQLIQSLLIKETYDFETDYEERMGRLELSESLNDMCHAYIWEAPNIKATFETCKNGRLEIKTASVPGLVHALIAGSMTTDHDFLTDFLRTYRYFSNALDISRLLIMSYIDSLSIAKSENLKLAKSKDNLKGTDATSMMSNEDRSSHIQLKILNVFKKWLSEQLFDFELDPQLTLLLSDFLELHVKKDPKKSPFAIRMLEQLAHIRMEPHTVVVASAAVPRPVETPKSGNTKSNYVTLDDSLSKLSPPTKTKSGLTNIRKSLLPSKKLWSSNEEMDVKAKKVVTQSPLSPPDSASSESSANRFTFGSLKNFAYKSNPGSSSSLNELKPKSASNPETPIKERPHPTPSRLVIQTDAKFTPSHTVTSISSMASQTSLSSIDMRPEDYQPGPLKTRDMSISSISTTASVHPAAHLMSKKSLTDLYNQLEASKRLKVPDMAAMTEESESESPVATDTYPTELSECGIPTNPPQIPFPALPESHDLAECFSSVSRVPPTLVGDDEPQEDRQEDTHQERPSTSMEETATDSFVRPLMPKHLLSNHYLSNSSESLISYIEKYASNSSPVASEKQMVDIAPLSPLSPSNIMDSALRNAIVQNDSAHPNAPDPSIHEATSASSSRYPSTVRSNRSSIADNDQVLKSEIPEPVPQIPRQFLEEKLHVKENSETEKEVKKETITESPKKSDTITLQPPPARRKSGQVASGTFGVRSIIEKIGDPNVITEVHPHSPILNVAARKMSILDLDPEQVARQLTVLEFELFRSIPLYEFYCQAWSNRTSKYVKAPHLVKFIRYFNHIAAGAASEVVRQSNIKSRVSVLKKLIYTAHYCVKMANFNTCFEIVAGLNLGPIARLKKTWKALPKKYWDVWNELNLIVSSEGSYKAYRQSISPLKEKLGDVPILPYVGVNLQDLTFAEDGNPTFLPDTLDSDSSKIPKIVGLSEKTCKHIPSLPIVNFTKLRLISKILNDISKQQKGPRYTFPVENTVLEWVYDGWPLLSEMDLYVQSKLCEPRAAQS